MTTICLLIAIAVYAACSELDVRWSERAFAKGFLEGNELIVTIFRTPAPKSWMLQVYGLAWLAILLAPVFIFNVDAIDFCMSGAITCAGLKHLMLVRKAKQQLAGTYKAPNSAFAKFLGL
jgi:hypothetical protein